MGDVYLDHLHGYTSFGVGAGLELQQQHAGEGARDCAAVLPAASQSGTRLPALPHVPGDPRPR
jgi:hypothetical protein